MTAALARRALAALSCVYAFGVVILCATGVPSSGPTIVACAVCAALFGVAAAMVERSA